MKFILVTKNVTNVIFTIAAIAAIAFCFQIWQGILANLSAPVFRPIHVSWVLALVFLVYPLFSDRKPFAIYLLGRIIDLVCGAHVLGITQIALFDYDDISFCWTVCSRLIRLRNCSHSAVTRSNTKNGRFGDGVHRGVVSGVRHIGDVLPDNIASKGFSVEEIIRFHIYSTNGVYGAPLAIAAGVVFMFVLFGAFYK